MKKLILSILSVIIIVFIISCKQRNTDQITNKGVSVETRVPSDSLMYKQEQYRLRQIQIQDSLKIVQDSLKIVELETFKNSIKIIKYYTSSPNSAGGVDCNIIWKNLSEKTVKYVRFTVVPYNAVNDRVKGEYDYNGNGEKTVRVTGPVKSKQINGYGTYWSCLWYNWTIDYMLITGIEIEYLDGSVISTTDVSVIEKLGYTKRPNI